MKKAQVDRLIERDQSVAGAPRVHIDLSPAKLVEAAVAHGEGVLASNGSLVVDTGERTGRSPHDRFVVDDPAIHDMVCWGEANVPMERDVYEHICSGVVGYLYGRELYVVHGLAGADRNHSRKVCVICERANQALFVHQMLVRPTARELASFGEPDIYVLAAPGYRCDPETDGTNSGTAVVLDLAHGGVVVAGTGYSGEIKKAVFSFMNYLLPVEDDVLSMHCSANVDPMTGQTAVLFGLSGTGKTTLSADPNRLLIGDDEHGWSSRGIFNIEGGCYAKAIDLSPIAEPDIYEAIRFGAVCENVILDPETREPDYTDVSRTQNTRVAYPVEHIKTCALMAVAAYRAWCCSSRAMPSACCRPSRGSPARRRCITSWPASHPRSREPRWASRSPRPRSRPCSASRSCRFRQASMPRCSASASTARGRASTS